VATRVILDTDIGTDVDDCLALAVILGSPELHLEGVTCVYGDVLLRVRMARKLLALAGRDDVPVMAGASEPLLRRRPVFWAGHEGEGLLEPGDEALAPAAEHAVDYLVRTIMAHPGEMHLLAIGPLTNVALAFAREPRLPSHLAHLTIMGGAVRGPGNFGLPYAEHNMRCDPEAAQLVLSAGAPSTLVPLDVTMRVTIDRAGLERIRAAGTPFDEGVAQHVVLYPRFAARGATYLHDPLAAAILTRRDLVDLTPLHIDLETEGHFTTAMTLAREPAPEAPLTAEVALTVDAAAAEEFILERIVG
jgi:purine nucleosidase